MLCIFFLRWSWGINRGRGSKKLVGGECERRGQICRIPREIGIVFPGSHNFSIYAISRSVPPDRKIGRNIWVGANLLSTAKTSSPHASQILSRLINNSHDAKINIEMMIVREIVVILLWNIYISLFRALCKNSWFPLFWHSYAQETVSIFILSLLFICMFSEKNILKILLMLCIL